MLTSLYRREALDARRNDWLGSIEVGPTRYGGIFAACALACVAAIAGFLVFGRYTRHERVEGELVPSGGLVVIAAPSAGVVVHCLIGEGERVVEGQPIVEVNAALSSAGFGDTHALIDTQLRAQQASLNSDLAEQRALAQRKANGLRERIGMLQSQLALLDTQRALKQRQSASAAALIERIRPLRDKGVLGAFEWEQRESAALDADMQLKGVVMQRLDTERELNGLRGELDQLPLTGAAARNGTERQLADVSQALARNEAERSMIVRAPRAGTVAGLTAVQGQAIAAGQRLTALIPDGSQLQAELWVPSRAVGFIAAGSRVVLRYHAYPYQTFGSQAGRVVEVGTSALPPAELDSLHGGHAGEPMYRVRVALDAQAVAAFGRALPLKTSMTLDADVLLDRQRLLDWIVAPLYGTADRATSAGPA